MEAKLQSVSHYWQPASYRQQLANESNRKKKKKTRNEMISTRDPLVKDNSTDIYYLGQ